MVFDVESAADAGKFSGIDTDRLFDVAGWTAIQTADSVVMGNIGIYGYDDGIPGDITNPGYTEKWKESVAREHGKVLEVIE